jgi:hypothetical protein
MSTTDQRLAIAIDHDMRAENGLHQQFSVGGFLEGDAEDQQREQELESMEAPKTEAEK